MPLLFAMLCNAAVGLLLAESAARELRASPRAVVALRGFAGVATHEGLVAVPALFWLLMRHTDWMLSYAVPGQRLPSALGLMLCLVHGALGLGAFSLGARWFREHRAGRIRIGAAALVGVGLVLTALLRHRVLWVGNYLQFRGGFGLRGLWGSEVAWAVAVAVVVQAGAVAHVAWWLRRER